MDKKILCPRCGYPMHKAGKVWSGKNRVQRYRCNKCGRTTVNKKPAVADGLE